MRHGPGCRRAASSGECRRLATTGGNSPRSTFYEMTSAADSCICGALARIMRPARSVQRELEGAGMISIRRNLDSVGYRLALRLRMREAFAATRSFC